MGKRILFVAMNLSSGGAERQMVAIASAFKKTGNDVSFVCYEYGDFFLEHLEDAGIKVTWLLKKGVLSRLFSFRKFIRKGNFDVVISFLETPNILNYFAAIGPHSWRVITGERSAKYELLSSRRGKIVAWLQKRSDCLVCNSYNSASLWRKLYPSIDPKIRTIYNLIQVPSDLYDFKKPREGNNIRIVVAASYQYLKNPINVVNAIAMLSDEELNSIRLDWYGNTKAVPSAFFEVSALIKEKHLERNVFLHEATKDIFNEMALADYVGLFSSVEGLPNAICEAMLIGKPIIFSRVSDYAQLVQGNGFLCDGNNVDSIKLAIQKSINSSNEDIIRMGKRSRELANSLFGAEHIISQWESILF